MQPIISQNVFKDKYDLGILFSSEFYNADFTTLNKNLEKIDSKEILGTSFGLTLSKKESKNYTTLEFQILQNYSDLFNLKGYSLNISTNYDILKKSKNHLLYPILGVGIDKYSLKFKQNLNLDNNSVLKNDEFISDFSLLLSGGIGYEYILNIMNLRFSIGLNFEKSTFVNKLKWELENSSINYFQTNLVHGIKTKAIVRLIF